MVCYTLFGRSLQHLVPGHASVKHRIKEYVLGLYHNCLAIRSALGGWHVRLYLAENLYISNKDTFDRLMTKFENQLFVTLVQKAHLDGDFSPTLWRILPFFERGVNVALLRDLDDVFLDPPQKNLQALRAWIDTATPFHHQRVTRAVIDPIDPNVKRSGNDEYPISAGWFGYHASHLTRLDKLRSAALENIRTHVRSDTTYCTDERWLYKAAGLFFGLGEFKRNKWTGASGTITAINEIRESWPWYMESNNNNTEVAQRQTNTEYNKMLSTLPRPTGIKPRVTSNPWE
jgi:hypothetical protein